jgi:Putative auto-transporter adhesin, head GIN domain
MAMSDRRTPRRSRAVPVLVGVLAAFLGVAVIATLVNREGHSTAAPGSGVAVTQARRLRPFTTVELAGANTVRISVGTPQRVTVFADDDLLARVTTVVHDETLTIDTRGRFESRSPTRVEIDVPRLDEVSLSGSGTVFVAGIRAATFTATLPGSGVLTLSGRSGAVHTSIGGSGTIDAAALSADAAEATLSGTGTIELTATDQLDAAISGTGTITCYGHPAKGTRTTTGSGVILTP